MTRTAPPSCRFGLVAGLALAIAACGAPSPGIGEAREGASLFESTPAADLPLPNSLREVSGLALTEEGRLFGHDDERGVVRQIDLTTGAVVKSFAVGDPAERDDFEGLAVAGADFYLVTSTGRLLRFREGADGAHVAFSALDTGLGPVCEIEGLAYQPTTDSLILACKSMLDRSMRKKVGLYAWSIAAGALTPLHTYAEKDLARAAGVEAFHPSSVERDPISGRLVLLAAREGGMVELGPDGAILAGRQLGARHAQAEGAAILADGALLIADEATERAGAHLSRYQRRP
jgi:uncharacterized protein YjiK